MSQKPILLAGEPEPGETARNLTACNDYLRLGPGRSLSKLLKIYRESAAERPPSKNQTVLERWSRRFHWVARAAEYDAAQELIKTAEIQRLRTEGLAADHKRIDELTQLYNELRAELDTGLWYDDIKIVPGEGAVEVPAFKAQAIQHLRGTLDDIAKEVGGRRFRSESWDIDYSQLSDDQLERIAGGEDVIKVILSPGTAVPQVDDTNDTDDIEED